MKAFEAFLRNDTVLVVIAVIGLFAWMFLPGGVGMISPKFLGILGAGLLAGLCVAARMRMYGGGVFLYPAILCFIVLVAGIGKICGSKF